MSSLDLLLFFSVLHWLIPHYILVLSYLIGHHIVISLLIALHISVLLWLIANCISVFSRRMLLGVGKQITRTTGKTRAVNLMGVMIKCLFLKYSVSQEKHLTSPKKPAYCRYDGHNEDMREVGGYRYAIKNHNQGWEFIKEKKKTRKKENKNSYNKTRTKTRKKELVQESVHAKKNSC